MAGYMMKLNGYNYPGTMTSAANLENGMIVKIDGGKLVAATKTTDYIVAEIPDDAVTEEVVAGAKAYRVEKVVNPVYFVETLADINDSTEYDTDAYVVKAGEFVRVHPLSHGEEFCSDKI